jgi:hypothetical protein
MCTSTWICHLVEKKAYEYILPWMDGLDLRGMLLFWDMLLATAATHTFLFNSTLYIRFLDPMEWRGN